MASSLSYTLVAGKISDACPDISHRRASGLRRHSFLGDPSVSKVLSEPLRSRKATDQRAINQAGAAPTSSARSAPRLELPIQTDINEPSPADSENRTEESEDRFTWSSNWFAVQVVEFMDASRPHAVTVLGRPYVLWRDAKGEWRCFVDECPHRLVPLSEVRWTESRGSRIGLSLAHRTAKVVTTYPAYLACNKCSDVLARSCT